MDRRALPYCLVCVRSWAGNSMFKEGIFDSVKCCKVIISVMIKERDAVFCRIQIMGWLFKKVSVGYRVDTF